MMSFFSLVEQKYDDIYCSDKYYYDPQEQYRKAYIEACLALIKTEFDPNEREPEDGETILMVVATTGRLDLVKFLVDAGADVNAFDYDGVSFALQEAARLGWQKMYDYLAPLTDPKLQKLAEKRLPEGLAYRRKENQKLAVNFVKAAWHGEIDKLQTAIENGVKIDVIIKMPGSDGESALHRACKSERTSIIRILLNKGANPNIRENKSGETPLMKAIKAKSFKKENKIDIVQLFILAGANVNAQDNNGNTALSLAQKIGNPEIIQLLIEAGAREN